MKNGFTKHVSFMSAVLIIALSFTFMPFAASADTSTVSKDNARTMVYEMIKSGVENLAVDIDISDYAQFTAGEINDIVNEVVLKNPELFYFNGKGETTIQNGKVVIISPIYIYTISSILSMKSAFLKYADEILAQSESSWGDFEKSLYVYEYLARQYAYDDTSSYDDAFDLLKNKTGTSLAFASLSYYLFKRLGVGVEYANVGSYYFNAVKISGNWYYFDAAQGNEGVGYGMIHLNTFLISGEKAKSIYDTIECNVSCTSTSYDSAAWKVIYSGFAYANSGWYYADSEANGAQYECHIYRYDFNTNKSVKVDNINIGSWKVWGEKSKVYTECFTGVVENNGFIYYNTPESICKYDPSSGVIKEISKPSTTSGYIYGISISADNLYYIIEKEYSESSDYTDKVQLNEKYKIIFMSKGTVVKTYELAYGKTIPETASPVKESYNTSSWDYFMSGMTVFGDAVFNAVYTNTFTYEFTDEDGTVLLSTSAIEGSYIIPPETNPEKNGTGTANYSFSYWDGYTVCMKLSKNIKFKAVYEKTDKYKITLVYLNQNNVVYANPGDILDSLPAPDPLTWTDKQYTYTYGGWEGYTAGMAINSDVTFTMIIKKELRQYTYKFLNYDGTVYYSNTADYGTVITAPSGKPTYSDNTGFSYTFLGWDGFTKGQTLTQDTVYYASFKGVKNNEVAISKYNISLYRDDGILLATESIYKNQPLNLVSGEELDYEDLQYYYDFQEWDGYEDGMIITENMTFVATYKKIAKQYKYTFYNNDGSMITECQGVYGSVIQFPEEPVINADYSEIYKFTGWAYKINEDTYTLEEGKLLDGEYYFIATYKQAYTQCTLTFVDDDGTALSTQVVDVLSTITGDLNQTYILNDKEDEEYYYEFAGWSGFAVNMLITKDMTFTAAYNKTAKETGRSRLPVPSEEESGLLEGKTLYIIIGGGVLLIIIILVSAICVGSKKKNSAEKEAETGDNTDKSENSSENPDEK